MLRNGTYLRESDGATLLYYSPYNFEDAAVNFRMRRYYDDSWSPISVEEAGDLHEVTLLQPGENVFIRGGDIQ